MGAAPWPRGQVVPRRLSHAVVRRARGQPCSCPEALVADDQKILIVESWRLDARSSSK
jgi:hypothetical protein